MGTNEKEKIVSHNVMVLLRVSRDPRLYKMPLCFYSEHNLACGHSKVSTAKVNYKSQFFRWLNWITLKISPKTPALPTKTPIRGNFCLSLKEKKNSGKKKRTQWEQKKFPRSLWCQSLRLTKGHVMILFKKEKNDD